jgi:hypothetical protein
MKKAFLISLLTLLFIFQGNFISAQGIKGFTASSEILFNTSDALHGPDVSLINNYKITRFPYIVQHTISSCLVDGGETTVEFEAPLVRNQLESEVSETSLELLSCRDIESFNKGVQLFENWNFVESQKLFYSYTKAHPEDKVARYYLALSQLYSGRYGAAASNFSLLNKNLAFAVGFINPEFKDDVKFYFGISSLMIPDGRKISASLFRQLNYEGGKYQNVCKGLIDLL